jgi:pimeloyl-ACP methyl ester carboxylesterase
LKTLYQSEKHLDRERLQGVNVPFLLIIGEHDPYASLETFVRLYRTFPHAQIAITPGCGHCVLTERPQLTRELIRGFLPDETSGRGVDKK